MYATDNDPTQMIYRSNPGNQRRLWLAVGAGVLAVAVLTFLIVIAFNARGDQANAALEAPVSTPTAEPTVDPSEGEETEGGLGGNQEPQNTGGDQGNQGGGPDPGQDGPGKGDEPEEDPEEDPGEDPEEEPGEETTPLQLIPLTPTISASVSEPGLLSCLIATAKITVTGVLFAPMEIKYQFVKFGFVDQPLGGVQSVVFNTAGEKTVASPALPKNEDGHLIYLQISAPKEIKSHVVLYPACG